MGPKPCISHSQTGCGYQGSAPPSLGHTAASPLGLGHLMPQWGAHVISACLLEPLVLWGGVQANSI